MYWIKSVAAIAALYLVLGLVLIMSIDAYELELTGSCTHCIILPYVKPGYSE
jgi:hypothetical protein